VSPQRGGPRRDRRQSKAGAAAVDLTGKPATAWQIDKGLLDEHAHPDDFGKSEGNVGIDRVFRHRVLALRHAAPYMSALYRKYQPLG